MKILFILAVVILTAQAYKENMLKSNKTPKNKSKKVETGGNSAVCDECKEIVTRFSKALEDPTKIAELKAILRMLCHETSYVEECKMFVNRLDYFIAHIEPYLKDPESACKHLRMCSNKKIETFHKISVVYMERFRDGDYVNNDLICEECQFAAAELKNLVEEEKSQQKIKTFLSEEVCKRLGKYQGSCDLMLDEFLPSLFEELDKMLANSKQFCTDLGLCKAVTLDGLESDDSTSDDQRVFVSKILVDLLKERKTISERSIIALFKRSVKKFATNEANRTPKPCITNSCKSKVASLVCHFCRQLDAFVQDGLNNPDVQDWLRNEIEEDFCSNFPETFDNICENVVENYMPVLLEKARNYLQSHDICRDDLRVCVSEAMLF